MEKMTRLSDQLILKKPTFGGFMQQGKCDASVAKSQLGDRNDKKTDRQICASGSIPDFLIKTTFGCSIVMILVVIPFMINAFIQNWFIIGIANVSIIVACGINIWYGYHGRYNVFVNTYLLVPFATFDIIYSMIQLAELASYWPFMLVIICYITLPGNRAGFFNLLNILIFVPVALLVMDKPMSIRFSLALLGLSLSAYIAMREIRKFDELFKEQAVKDKLTGLFNRNLLENSLQQAIAQNQRDGVPMALISFDIDHFKSINDTLGHGTGDMVLKGIGTLLGKCVRSSDMAFRIGGEEFLVIVHNTDKSQSAKVAEKLHQEVGLTAFLPDRQVTISVGVSCLQEGMDMATWMKSCDEKLYYAKQGGRNRVVV
jgi:diguanylate cyclase (GGDEF)-like protein